MKSDKVYAQLDAALTEIDRLNDRIAELERREQELLTVCDHLRDAWMDASADQPQEPAQPAQSEPDQPEVNVNEMTDEDQLLTTIVATDRELGTENYVPIYAVRPLLPWKRDRFDRALYNLSKTDRLDLSTLQEANAYTPDQIDAGIPQNIGGSIFFLTVL